MNERIKHGLSRVCWICGGTDAGKSTLTGELAQRYRLPVYHYDAHDLRHHLRLAERDAEHARFLAQSYDERWAQPSVDALVERTWRSFRDRFPLVIEDLTALELPPGMSIIAEGFGLTPSLVNAAAGAVNRMVCLVPTDEFKVASMERRGKGRFGGEVSDPARAFANLLHRDQALATRVRAEATALDVPVIEVDGTRSVQETADLVASRFGL